MTHQRPSLGFTIIESLIIVAIIGILAAVAVPTYITYTKKSHFNDVVKAAEPYQRGVEACYQSSGSGATVTGCGAGSHGVPAAQTTPSGVVGSILVSNDGVITATGRGDAGTDTLILKPIINNKVLTWDKGGTCVTNAIC